MITKEKLFSASDDPRVRAGDEAEKDMAFRLARRFGNDRHTHIINDLRIEHDGTAFQIDHLLVTPWGLFIVESKSVHGTVTIKAWDDRREHWSRSYSGDSRGIDSPVLQAEEQGRLLKRFLRDHAEQVLGKLIGLVQKGFGYCPVECFVAISSTGIIEVTSGDLPDKVFKADEVAPEIARRIEDLKKKAKLLNLSIDVGWEMRSEEAAAVANFLAHSHKPPKQPIAPQDSTADVVPAKSQSSVPRAGATCPRCKTRKLVRKSVSRPDGTETDFLACEGHPKDCSQIFALVTKTLSSTRPDGEQHEHAMAPNSSLASSAAPLEPRAKSEQARNYCFKCRKDISAAEAKYCFDKRGRFGGRAYCRSCQNTISTNFKSG